MAAVQNGKETRHIVPYWRVGLQFRISCAKVQFGSVNINNDKTPYDMCGDVDFVTVNN